MVFKKQLETSVQNNRIQDQNVKFEIRVPNYTYIGVGNAENEEMARKKALEDIVLYLARQNEIPIIPKKKNKIKNDDSKIDSTKIKKLNNLESVVCGNWTVDTAYERLKEFVKSNDKANFKVNIETIGRNFVVCMSMFIEKLNETISTRETGKSKKKVMQQCEVTLVNNLCTLGLIERYSGDQVKKDRLNCIHNSFNVVNVNEKLVKDIYSLLEDLNIKPIIDKNQDYADILNKTELLLDKVIEPFKPLNHFNASKVVLWCPPASNWNPWLAVKICNPKPLSEISYKMKKEFDEKKQHSITFQKRIKDRSNLPIFKKKDSILDIIRDNAVVIVHGGTGCGKTTQVCQFILEEFIHTNKGAYCNIVCTQPRKVSAISIANRVSFERAEAIGKSVGYTVRFDSIVPQSFGAILFCTVEILIRKLKTGLFGITHIVVDEIHERRAGCELLLIILKDMVQKYQDLKVILMSANANLNIFSKYFNNCPVIDVEGNCYPVKDFFLEDIVEMINYTPPLEEIKSTKKKNKDNSVNCNLLVPDNYPRKVREVVAKISEDSQHLKIIELLLKHIENNLKTKGAVLIFLPGWAWISELNNYLQQNEMIAQNCSILLLHSSLSHAQQHKVFKPVPPGKRKVILSTNIAETSITIDDVVFVIDYGKSKIVRCINNVTKFDTIWASKVNVVQRRGRAGRVQEGICFNLYTKERYNKMDDNILPELNHCSLNKIGLTIKLLNLGDIYTFLKKAIDPPPAKSVYHVIDTLKEMKCLDVNGNLTALGFILADLPVEPQLGRMMILGNILLLGESLSIIAAGSTTNYDLFLGDYGQNTAKHYYSGNRCSDQLTFLNAFMQCESTYDYYTNDINDFGENGLSTSVLKATYNIKKQIINKFLKFGFPKCCFKSEHFDFGKTANSDEPQLDMLSALLVMAFYPNIYVHKEKRKVNLKSQEFAVVCKSSVNSPVVGSSDRFQLPFFVFEQQISVMCMNTSMVSPIHILLFGAHKVDYTDGCIVLDDWIYLRMDVKVAAAIVALRPAIEDLIMRTVEDPKLILKPTITDIKLIKLLRDLCNFNAGRDNLTPITFDTSEDGKDKNKNNKTKQK
ncbi:dosage compensation regulator-like isoform X2 [Rhopalosiphum padi]|uniref:dosage compensation regulator-like isoform X2 n=1 Tax=Rhopalosiphum padi TaxID=40932 RepID=UPI00298E14E3|nr:dosage compensation regulator-like isoform X2 [Rhopalosiphum padi]